MAFKVFYTEHEFKGQMMFTLFVTDTQYFSNDWRTANNTRLKTLSSDSTSSEQLLENFTTRKFVSHYWGKIYQQKYIRFFNLS